jgi:hypothetical protein
VIGRRKKLPSELRAPYEAFHEVLLEIEPAKAGLADVLPSTRLPGRPLNDAVDEYRTRLVRATSKMAAWRRPELEDLWRACTDGLTHGIDRATRLLERETDPAGFEGLLGTVEQLMDPLDPFAAAEERFRSLRRRPRREH